MIRLLALGCAVGLWAAPVVAQSNAVNSGPTLPAACVVGSAYITTVTPTFYSCATTNTWTAVTWNGSLPSGAIIFVATGTCPATYTEVSALNGKMIRGTVAANMDVGTTGGSDTYTPAGTISALTFVGSALGTHTHTTTATGSNGTVSFTPVGTVAWPAGVPTNANESAHTHSVTAAGTNGTVAITPLGTNAAITAGTPAGTNAASATSGNCAATNVAIGTGATNACKATAPNLTVTAQTFTGSALGTHTHTFTGSSTTVGAETFTGSAVTSGAGSAHTHVVSWPAGVPALTGTSGTVPAETFTGNSVASSAVSGGTPAGTIATPTLAGTQATVVPAYELLIACSKN